MLDWLIRHHPGRTFIEAPGRRWTFGEILDAVEARPVDGTEVLRPRLDVSSVIDLLAVMSKGSAVIVGEDGPDVFPIDPAGAASVIFTSGSSGRPKGVRLTRGNWEAAADASMRHLGHGPEDIWLLAMPLHHVAGLSIILRSAYAGGSVRMFSGFDPGTYTHHLRDGVTMASMVPTMLTRVLDADRGPYEGLKAVLLGGGPIPDDLLDRARTAGLPVLPTYGLTETAGQVATLRPGAPVENKAHPLPEVELRIELDGRIAVRGPMVSPGYVGQPDRGPGEWLVTEDLGSLDGDGSLRVIGRGDAVIVSGGENIDPVTIESVVVGAPGVEDALVVGLPSPEWGMEAACLYVGEASPGSIESYLKGRVPAFMVPKRWLQVTDLPMTPMGKPDRSVAAQRFS